MKKHLMLEKYLFYLKLQVVALIGIAIVLYFFVTQDILLAGLEAALLLLLPSILFTAEGIYQVRSIQSFYKKALVLVFALVPHIVLLSLANIILSLQ
ncbi:MAG: hypothetical protein Q8L30_02335 [bacterium]|nr:hypothetical protein [bacterium]